MPVSAGLAQLTREADPGAQTFAIVRSASGSFPKVVSSGAESGFDELGFRTVLLREYQPAVADFAQVLGQVEVARPDVLLAVGRIENDLLLAQQLVRRGLSLGVAAVVASPIQQFRDALQQ